MANEMLSVDLDTNRVARAILFHLVDQGPTHFYDLVEASAPIGAKTRHHIVDKSLRHLIHRGMIYLQCGSTRGRDVYGAESAGIAAVVDARAAAGSIFPPGPADD